MHIKTLRKNRAFTLIEVLVVIGIIAVLAAVVLVAINPSRQFKLARDLQRSTNIDAIVSAIHQNISEHKGTFVCRGSVRDIPAILTKIKSSAAVGDLGDIANCLVPDYIASLPFDPSLAGAHFASTTDYDTGYEFLVDSNGRLFASSTGELTSPITTTR